ncbi:MAG: hypothetical protein V7L26_13315 [Nostoc sp.]|uniref:hypothetical protein n=1 Tax=Nostoc sp. TaxID=1180 RepID=UPI002FF23065
MSVQTDDLEFFALVPLHPQELQVQLNKLVLHTPGFETLIVENATGLYVVFQKDPTHLRVQHFN